MRSFKLLSQIRTLTGAGVAAAPEWTSASFLALSNAVLRTAVSFLMQAVAATLLFFALPAIGADSQEPSRDRAADHVESRLASPRPADEMVEEIETQLRIARRPLPGEKFTQTHTKLATLVDELRGAYPDDHRIVKFLPERWMSLRHIGRKEEARTEIEKVLRTTKDPVTKREALFHQAVFRIQGQMDGPEAAALAESFARQFPDDRRSSELLFLATEELSDAWYSRIVLVVLLVVIGGLTEAAARKRPLLPRKRWMLVVLLGLLGILILLTAILFFNLLPDARTAEAVASVLLLKASTILPNVVASRRAGFALAVACIAAIILALSRRRSAGASQRWTSFGYLWILGFTATLAIGCILDACLIAHKRAELAQRLVQEYPDSFRGRLAQGQDRQRERIGEPFELDFNDAISGRRVSMKDFRGKVVVVEFWATWCGPCLRQMAEMQRLYAKYHDRGVEFIGVNHDPPEEDGGLDALKAFVAKERIPWPQFYEGRNSFALRTGSAMNDFSESWGIDGIPAVFLIDADGNLYSTDAGDKLEPLILRLLKMSAAP